MDLEIVNMYHKIIRETECYDFGVDVFVSFILWPLKICNDFDDTIKIYFIASDWRNYEYISKMDKASVWRNFHFFFWIFNLSIYF